VPCLEGTRGRSHGEDVKQQSRPHGSGAPPRPMAQPGGFCGEGAKGGSPPCPQVDKGKRLEDGRGHTTLQWPLLRGRLGNGGPQRRGCGPGRETEGGGPRGRVIGRAQAAASEWGCAMRARQRERIWLDREAPPARSAPPAPPTKNMRLVSVRRPEPLNNRPKSEATKRLWLQALKPGFAPPQFPAAPPPFRA
jgi:hypothetical protein